MTKPVLGIDDILLQLAVCLSIHWLVGAAWTFEAVAERFGAVVPAALVMVALWRVYIYGPLRQGR